MSDDLISRKAVLERLQLLRKLNTEEAIQIAIDAVEQQISFCKAAFDKEKVINELEELRMQYFLTIANTGDEKLDCAYEYVSNALDYAVKIIEKGGI